MADFVHNWALSRVGEFYNRIQTNDPANAIFQWVVLNTTETDTTLKRLATLDDILSNVNTQEVNNANYVRKNVTDAEIVAFAPDNVNDRVDLVIPSETWTSIGAGIAWTDINIVYDSDSTIGDDTTVIPCTQHDFPFTPSGGDVTAQVPVTGFFRAQ